MEGDSKRPSAHTTNYLSEQMIVRSMDIKKLSAEISSIYQQRDVRLGKLLPANLKNRYISMIVKDFLSKFNIDDLVDAYYLYEEDICNYHGTTKQITGKEDARKYALKKALNEIILLDPIENLDYIIFSVPHPNSQGLDSFLVKKEEIFNSE